MKRTLRLKYQILLLIFLAIIILETVLVFSALIITKNPILLKSKVQFILILFFLIQFVYFIVLFYFIPHQYERALKEIQNIIKEISEGKMQIDYELVTHNQDLETVNLISAMERMMNIIIRFDNLKTDKIFEHHQRLQALVNLIQEGCLIITIIGEIVYLNDFVTRNFPALSENLNIIETLLPDYLEDALKPRIIVSLKNSENIHDDIIEISQLNSKFKVNSSIIRNRKGQTAGAVFTIDKA